MEREGKEKQKMRRLNGYLSLSTNLDIKEHSIGVVLLTEINDLLHCIVDTLALKLSVSLGEGRRERGGEG